MPKTRYTVAPGVEVVPLGEHRYALRSDFVALELSGETAAEFVEKVLLSLREPLTFAAIVERMPGYRPESLRDQIDALVREGILEAAQDRATGAAAIVELMNALGLDGGQALQNLASTKVAIFGLEAHGAHAARMLADAGVGTLLVADPFPFTAAHFALTPAQDPGATGHSRQDVVAGLLANSAVKVETGGPALSREHVHHLAAGSRLLISCWDRGFRGHHWVNEAARDHAIPALFSEMRATSSFVGPFYFPERSACWMCCRMRAMACEEDFDVAMAYEEHLDRMQEPALAVRPVLPVLPVHLASTLALEALKYLLRLNQPILADHVLEFDALTSETRSHPVLVRPDCPVCSKKNRG